LKNKSIGGEFMPAILATTNDMDRNEWLEMRRKGIGGSDASIILGLNKYKTPFELWLEKTGQVLIEESSSEAAYFGNLFEDMVAKEFEVRMGKKVRKRNAILQHPDHEYIIANIDRKVVGEEALLECKTANQFLAKDWESEEIPESYLVQVQHYLGVLGYPKAYIAVLIGGNKFICKEVDRDEELISIIFEAEKHFWEYHVIGGNPPALDGSSAAEKYLKEKYAKAEKGKSIELQSTHKDRILEYFDLKKTISELEKQKKHIQHNLQHELKEAELGFCSNYEVAWKPIESNRVDSKLLKEKFPNIYKEVTKKSAYRRFDIKEAK
jgi:putative phage-type endonuclease